MANTISNNTRLQWTYNGGVNEPAVDDVDKRRKIGRAELKQCRVDRG
jgi:hypothetical protein